MDYVLFGIQGSGKGTQGKILAQHMGAAYFETGGELRRLAGENSELGQKVKGIIEAGHLVPNEVVMEIVENFLANKITASADAVIFDGIPRNEEQNKSLTYLLKKLGRDFTGIYFELARGEAERRLLARRLCGKCKTVYAAAFKGATCEKCGSALATRADDNTASIRTRIDIFYKETMPIIESWRAAGIVISVNAAGTIDEVTKELLAKIDG